MILIYFKRPELNQRRIFIGFRFNEKIFRIGYKIVFNKLKNKMEMIRHYYEVNENINIIENPNINLIDKRDLEYLKYFNYI